MNLRDVPIQRKLRFVILATCTAALCVASAALFALQYFFFQRDYKRDLESLAEIVSSIAAPAISRGGEDTSQAVLNALHAKPHVIGASIILNDGRTVAQTGEVEQKLQEFPTAADGFHTVSGHLIYVHPISDDTQRVGTLYLVSDYRKRSIHLHALYASIVVGVLALSFLIAVIISSRFERVICGPIQKLADTARRNASKSDYSLRAEKEANDEVGEFTDTFNGMLAQIQERDFALRHEIAERARAEEEVARIHQQLMDASRAAGMAEVATGVLHNVGNVLNSVNVSATLICDQVRNSKSSRLKDVVLLLNKHRDDLAGFFNTDPRGQKLPGYFTALAVQLKSERESLLKELADLRANLDHIKEAVSMQQAYAKRCGVLETVAVEDLVEDSLRMNTGALTRHHVALKRDYRARPQVTVDKHRVLQILVNLIRNAKYACDESGHKDKQVTVRIEDLADESLTEGVRISVIDNGVGIAPDVMGRLFSHGFTTRKSGHGFGLHSAALAAAELGGSLTADSEGLGRGAAFRLVLPSEPPERHNG